ncbi:hypothetical protein SASPL_151690 [Salvia splendens]|uniref:Uncharacterized protein n=1 Tax=Salvia splendens TaxID=180675 RepID=A0A8X8Z3M4_SALSN|nr:hypothetical protein SASPL_151690 [Salvia splendens]
MKIKLHSKIKTLFSSNSRVWLYLTYFIHAWEATEPNESNPEILDIRKEYAKAFRTESYTDFWTHVLALNRRQLTPHRSLGSKTAARLPSYRLFAENLLDPDQPTVKRILSTTRIHPKISPLLTDYFGNTSCASHLCGLLLKDINHIRKKFKSLEDPSKINHLPVVVTRVTLFSRSNPFSLLGASMSRLRAVQAGCSDLLRQLESRRDKALLKLRRLEKVKLGSALLLVAVTVSLVVVVAAHAFVMLVAAPTVMVELASMEELARWSAQLDTAAKGTYILIRDLDTIGRLVARLNNELERVDGLVQLWVQRRDDGLQGSEEVACQLKKNNQSFMEQLDELEEHLYLCFMTINRARNLVLKQILHSATLNSSHN